MEILSDVVFKGKIKIEEQSGKILETYYNKTEFLTVGDGEVSLIGGLSVYSDHGIISSSISSGDNNSSIGSVWFSKCGSGTAIKLVPYSCSQPGLNETVTIRHKCIRTPSISLRHRSIECGSISYQTVSEWSDIGQYLSFPKKFLFRNPDTISSDCTRFRFSLNGQTGDSRTEYISSNESNGYYPSISVFKPSTNGRALVSMDVEMVENGYGRLSFDGVLSTGHQNYNPLEFSLVVIQ